MAKDYCRYKPVGIQAYGVKCDYSDVALELIGNMDSNAEDNSNGTETKAPDTKKENETFSRKLLSSWLNMSNNNDSKGNQSDINPSTPSKTSTPIESMIICSFKYIFN